MTHDVTTLLNDALRLPEDERLEFASRLFAHESSVISSQPGVMSGAAVFKGSRVRAQTLFEYLESGDSIDDFLEGYPSVSRPQVLAFLEEIKTRVLGKRVILKHADWSPEFLAILGSVSEEIERPPQRKITEMKDPFD
jgi:uncharacterized protein (DUF433 family)